MLAVEVVHLDEVQTCRIGQLQDKKRRPNPHVIGVNSKGWYVCYGTTASLILSIRGDECRICSWYDEQSNSAHSKLGCERILEPILPSCKKGQNFIILGQHFLFLSTLREQRCELLVSASKESRTFLVIFLIRKMSCYFDGILASFCRCRVTRLRLVFSRTLLFHSEAHRQMEKEVFPHFRHSIEFLQLQYAAEYPLGFHLRRNIPIRATEGFLVTARQQL